MKSEQALEGMSFTLIDRNNLLDDGITYDFDGWRFEDANVSFIWVDMPPGGQVKLHRHPYPEIFIIEEGLVTFIVDTDRVEGHAGQIIIVPANTAHKFINSVNQRLKQVDIHMSPSIVTEWLEV